MKFHQLIALISLSFLLAGCPLDGDSGSKGIAGINCWDLNQNRSNDLNEDINKDGVWDVKDCSAQLEPSQSTEVAFNHQQFCEAFASLGQYPAGCPSNTHTPPTGTQTLQSQSTWYDDGMGNVTSCNQPAPNNGALSIESKGNLFYWVVNGGFIATKQLIDPSDQVQNQTCFTNCSADANCIASWAAVQSVGSTYVFACYHFYHSDTVSKWEQYCGQTLQACYEAQALKQQYWSVRCP